jgi:hypothetical protein
MTIVRKVADVRRCRASESSFRESYTVPDATKQSEELDRSMPDEQQHALRDQVGAHERTFELDDERSVVTRNVVVRNGVGLPNSLIVARNTRRPIPRLVSH